MTIFPTGNPVNTSGQLTLLGGCDYKAADGNAAIWTNQAGSWNNLTSAAVYLVAFTGSFPLPPVSSTTVIPPQWFPPPLISPIKGTVVTPTGNGQQVSFDIPASASAVRPNGSPTDLYAYGVYAQLTNGDVIPLVTGPLYVKGVTA